MKAKGMRINESEGNENQFKQMVRNPENKPGNMKRD
jgi:hypothetical protein